MIPSFLLTENARTRRHAANWLEVAERVHHFRRDLLSPQENHQLLAATGEVKTRLAEKADAGKLKLSLEKLEGVLRTTGGRIYPSSSLVENVEFFLVAAIVILGLRAYFVQPFKIPTNSMWPSYYGMTHELFTAGEEPGLAGRAARLLAFGATHFAAEAPRAGEVMIPVNRDLRVPYSEVTGRTFGIIPTRRREYTFMVDGAPTTLQVPFEFNLDRVLEDAYAGETGGDLAALIQRQVRAMNREPQSSVLGVTLGGRRYDQRVFWIPVGKQVRSGEPVISFDILTGDLLFVDRFTYNFFPPKVGQGFVFKTENIDSPRMKDRNGEQMRQYYIKRLVGGPGDRLEIRNGANGAGALFRNGAPITGADAFAANAARRDRFPGYVAAGLLDTDRTAEVPKDRYMALGDNSPHSEDSRFWGFIPEKDVVGRPLLIYYPLSKRWGVAN